MTTTNNKTPAADQGNESEEQLGNGSTTAYLAYPAHNTGHTYGTWSGDKPTIDDHITIIIPMKDARLMYADGTRLMRLNEDCVNVQSAVARKEREKKKAEEERKVRLHISREVEEEFYSQELAALDAQATKIYDQIDLKVQARLDAHGKTS